MKTCSPVRFAMAWSRTAIQPAPIAGRCLRMKRPRTNLNPPPAVQALPVRARAAAHRVQRKAAPQVQASLAVHPARARVAAPPAPRKAVLRVQASPAAPSVRRKAVLRVQASLVVLPVRARAVVLPVRRKAVPVAAPPARANPEDLPKAVPVAVHLVVRRRAVHLAPARAVVLPKAVPVAAPPVRKRAGLQADQNEVLPVVEVIQP
jgi:hypothetical protein